MPDQTEEFLACAEGDRMRATMPPTLAREEAVLAIAIQLTKKSPSALFVNPEEPTKRIKFADIAVVKKFEFSRKEI